MKNSKMKVTLDDYVRANRRASRNEEIASHGRPVTRMTVHRSKKVYDRKRLKKAGITSDDLPFSF